MAPRIASAVPSERSPATASGCGLPVSRIGASAIVSSSRLLAFTYAWNSSGTWIDFAPMDCNNACATTHLSVLVEPQAYAPALRSPPVTDDFEQQTFVMGMILGMGVGISIGPLATGTILPGVVYGPGGGIVVGAALAHLTPRVLERDRPRLAFVATAVAVGLAVGAPVGALVAWTGGASLLAGLLVGAAGGAAHGLLLAGSQLPGLGDATNGRRQTGSDDATTEP